MDVLGLSTRHFYLGDPAKVDQALPYTSLHNSKKTFFFSLMALPLFIPTTPTGLWEPFFTGLHMAPLLHQISLVSRVWVDSDHSTNSDVGDFLGSNFRCTSWVIPKISGLDRKYINIYMGGT